MLIRICLIVAVVAGIGAAVVNFVQVKEVITITRDTLNTTSNRLDQTEKKLDKTEKELKGTQAELAVTKDTLRTTEEARDAALADAEAKGKQIVGLTAKLRQTTDERDDAQARLAAWNALGIPVNQVKQMIADFNAAQEQIVLQNARIKSLTTETNKLNNELAYYRGPDTPVKLPASLKAKVIAYDPKWDFVVLSAGEDAGVLQRGELLLSRDGKLVSKVKVFRVQKDVCIANTVNGWAVGEIMEGDSAIPAFY